MNPSTLTDTSIAMAQTPNGSTPRTAQTPQTPPWNPNRLVLDTRQRAMLEAMGIPVWLPPEPAQTIAGQPAVAQAATQAVMPPVTQPAESTAQSTVSAMNNIAVKVDKTAARGQKDASNALQAPAPASGVPPRARTPAHPPPAGRPSTGSSAQPSPPATRSGAASWTLGAPQLLFDGVDAANTPAALGKGWLIIAEPAPDTQPDDPFAGDAGRLLANMLHAMKLHRHPRVYLAPLVPAAWGTGNAASGNGNGNGNVNASASASASASAGAGAGASASASGGLAHEVAEVLATTQPDLILVMGRVAAQALMQSSEPLGRLRGIVCRLPGVQPDVPAVITYDAPYLLRAQPDKARAWADLCLALFTVRQAHMPAPASTDL